MSFRVVEFLADGFEESEAIIPLDMLIRAGADIKTVSITENKAVASAHGLKIEADTVASELDYLPDMVILPGGMPGAANLRASALVEKTLASVNEAGGFLAAICAAPFVLGELGYLEGKSAICYPGFEDKLIGASVSDKKVVRDGRIITAAGMGVSIEFGYELVAALFGKETADSVKAQIIA